jgi:hypothetical protein
MVMSTESILRMESKIDNMLTAIETFPPKYRWCVEQFGPEGDRWCMVVAGTYFASGHFNEFKFADDRDLMLFILRWS